MKTLVASKNKEVAIDTAGPLTMIGEKINPTGRRRLTQAFIDKDFDYVIDEAVRQVESGADLIDINVGVPAVDEVALLPEVVRIVADAVDVPLSIDSPNRDAMVAANEVCSGRPLINSVNGEKDSITKILPLVAHYDRPVIGLTMDDDGIPHTPEGRLEIASRIIDTADGLGIPLENIIIDPLVMTVGADDKAAQVTLRTIELVVERYGVNVSLGASNVSFGLPERHTVNQAFMALAMKAGASCAITDVAKLSATIRATDMLRARDPHGAAYIDHYRTHIAIK